MQNIATKHAIRLSIGNNSRYSLQMNFSRLLSKNLSFHEKGEYNEIVGNSSPSAPEFKDALKYAHEYRVDECMNCLYTIQNKVTNDTINRDSYAVRTMNVLLSRSKSRNLENALDAIVSFLTQHPILDVELVKVIMINSFNLEKEKSIALCDQLLMVISPYFICNGGKLNPKIILLPVISCFLKGGDFARSNHLFKKLDEYHSELTATEVNVMMTYTIKKNIFAFYRVLTDYAEKKNLEFSIENLQYKLTAFLKAPHLDLAMDCFKVIIDKGGNLDIAVYIVLLDTLKRYGNSSPRYFEYISRILQQIEKSLDLKKIDERFFLAILNNLSEFGVDYQLFGTWLQRMTQYISKCQITTVNIILKAMCKNGMLDKAVDLLRTMEDKYGTAPNLVSFNTVLSACTSEMQFLEILREMEQRKIPKNLETYNIRLRRMCDDGRRDDALKLYRKMCERHLNNSQNQASQPGKNLLAPDCVTLTILVHAFKDKSDVVDSLFRDCQALGLQPDYFLVMELLRYSSEFREALKSDLLVDELASSNLRTSKLYPDLYPELLYIMKSTKDEQYDITDRKSVV